MANFASDKMFLSQTGVQALIKKIADIRKEILEGQTGIANDFAELSALVDSIIAKTEDGVIAKGMLANVIAEAEALRNELGEVPADAAKTIYTRLADAETAINNLIAGDLTEDFNDLKSKAFVDAVSTYDSANQKVKLSYKNAAGAEVKLIEIDTADFIVHGMMEDVNTVTIESSKVTLPDGTVLDVPVDVMEHKGDKYLVFRFKLAHENTDSDVAHDELKAVWVNVHQLFNDYDFVGESDDADYVTVTATETSSTTAADQNLVTIKVALGAAQKAVNNLVEGKTQYEGKPVGENYRGVADLNKALDAEIEAREAVGTAAAEVKTIADRLVEEVETEGTGLLDRTTSVESRVDDLEQWTNTQFLSPKWVEDYVEWTITGKTGEAPNPNDEKYKA